MALTPAFVSLKILSKNTSFSFHAFTVDHLGGPLVYCLLFGPDRQPQAKQAPDDPCTSPIFERNGQIMAYGPPPLLTYYAKLMHENWTNTHPYTRYGPSYHTTLPTTSHWAQEQAIPRFEAISP
jgi:hypothetical protein